MQVQLIINSTDFWKHLQNDILKAQKRVWIQTMSFEGDSIGKQLVTTLEQSKAPDRRMLIDTYSRYVVNDQFLWSPSALFDSALQKEVQETRRLVQQIQEQGIQVQFTNPIGFGLFRYPARNHKKLILIDDHLCYLGGINFCEHNFGWHDMMLKYEGLGRLFLDDFETTWTRKNHSKTESLGEHQFFVCDGKRSTLQYQQIANLFHEAKSSIVIHSPYFTFPWMQLVLQASKRGVKVTILTPSNNNKSIVNNYLMRATQGTDVELRVLSHSMSHLKAILIDDSLLISGSSNFDCISYYAEQEIIVVSQCETLVSQFQSQILVPDLQNSRLCEDTVPMWKGILSEWALKIAAWYCKIIG